MPARSDRKKKLLKKRSVTSVRDFHTLMRERPRRPSMVSEGDSWFDYPPPNLIGNRRSNIVDFIEHKRQFNLLRLERNGDEAVAMMAGDQLTRLAKVIHRDPVQFILFSGGGNDIAGAYRIEMYLKPKQPGGKWKECIDHERFQRKLDMVENAYRMLVDIVEEYAKNRDTLIVTHTYGLAIPDGRRAEFLLGAIGRGPWLKPFMEAKDISAPGDQQAIVKFFLKEFAKRLKRVEQEFPHRLKVVNTQGILQGPEDWDNELHPTRDGFRRIADAIWEVLQDGL